MARWMGIAVLLAAAGLGWAQAPDTRLEDVIKQMLSTMDGLTKVLTKIEDEETAQAAHPELKKSAEEWLAIRKKAEKTPPPTKEEKEKLTKEYRGKLEEAQKKLFAEISRVQAIKGGKEALAEVSKALSKKSP